MMNLTKKLKELDDMATKGEWGRYHFRYGPWQEEADNDNVLLYDNTHQMSAMPNGERVRIAEWSNAVDAGFAETLVNAYRNGDMIVINPEPTLEWMPADLITWGEYAKTILGQYNMVWTFGEGPSGEETFFTITLNGNHIASGWCEDEVKRTAAKYNQRKLLEDLGL